MAVALELAARGDYATSPNPMVGCVIVRDGGVVGRGYHRRAGEAHAEVEALAEAGERARGATAYVTLEPCSHQGRTPPCAPALIAAGIARCVIATSDPNPQADSVQSLRDAGVEVETGVLEKPAARLNEFFFTRMTTGRPFVTAKFAATLDGRVTLNDPGRRWISGPESRAHAHRLRHQHDAILVGAGTAVIDDPALTTRTPEGVVVEPRSPVPVLIDTRLRTPPSARIFDRAGALVYCTEDHDAERARQLRDRGAEVLTTGASERGVDLGEVLADLARRQFISVLVEGGPHILGSVLGGALADKIVAYLAPLAGGAGGLAAVIPPEGVDAVARLHDVTYDRRGDDLVITGYCERQDVQRNR